MNEKQTLKQLLETSEGKKILFLGHKGIFTDREIGRFLKKFKVSMTREYEEGLAAVVEYHRLNPVEEDISNMVYDTGIPLYKLVEFEKLLSEKINDDELLMGIKLSNDQERILRILGNEHISDALFVKLLKMYVFDEEEEDNRDDRNVIMYTLRRYIDIKPSEEDLLYSYLTLRRLATEATDPDLLNALTGFPNFEFLVRGKEKITLRETIARNPAIDEPLVRKLLAFRDLKIDQALASNPSVSLEVLKELSLKKNEGIEKALATNSAIDDEVFGALLERDESVIALLLLWQPINPSRLEQIERMGISEDLYAILGANETLESDVVLKLLEKEEPMLLEALSGNRTIQPDILAEIYQKDEVRYFGHLARNPSVPVWILQTFYEEFMDDESIMTALAYNASTPEKILKELFDRDLFEINRGLATNASLPLELLDILKVDTRLQNELAQNENLVNSYEQVLNQDKVMMNV
ncbi:hypothetical protein [Sulfurovum riftiae]|nr:hypothetical protein [Sulfurovum riftiae]